MKISFITTVDHNVGDDFVREGIKYLVKKALEGTEIEFQNIHKHSPITVRNGFEWFKNVKFSKFTFPSQKLDKLLPVKLTGDKILDADLVIQSGAPVYWCHKEIGSYCSQNEWYDTLIERRIPLKQNPLLFNIGAGACQHYYSDGTEFNDCTQDLEYITEFYNLSKLTTVRDKLARKVLGSIGLEVNTLPCPSIFAINEYNLQKQPGKYIIFNYMELAGHYAFSKDIDKDRWFTEMSKTYHEIKKKEEILFVCHNKAEVENAKRIDPDANIFFSKDYLEYMKIYSQAKFGVMNRVHGAFLIASYGTPSVIIGNDSRARMAEEIGLESFYVNDVSSEILIEKYNSWMEKLDTYKQIFASIKQQAEEKYVQLLSEAL